MCYCFTDQSNQGVHSMAAPLSLKAIQQRLSLVPCILLIFLGGPFCGETISDFSWGLPPPESEAGWYAVQSQAPPFRFGGDLGMPLSDLVMGGGSDNLG